MKPRVLRENMEKRDWYVLGALAVVWVSSIVFVDRWWKGLPEEEQGPATILGFEITIAAMALAMLVSIGIIYYAARVYGGTVGKGLYMFVWGLIFQLSLPIEVYWHILNLPHPVGPAWLGIDPYWWLGFFHTAIAVGLALKAYGFYLIVQGLGER